MPLALLFIKYILQLAQGKYIFTLYSINLTEVKCID